MNYIKGLIINLSVLLAFLLIYVIYFIGLLIVLVLSPALLLIVLLILYLGERDIRYSIFSIMELVKIIGEHLTIRIPSKIGGIFYGE